MYERKYIEAKSYKGTRIEGYLRVAMEHYIGDDRVYYLLDGPDTYSMSYKNTSPIIKENTLITYDTKGLWTEYIKGVKYEHPQPLDLLTAFEKKLISKCLTGKSMIGLILKELRVYQQLTGVPHPKLEEYRILWEALATKETPGCPRTVHHYINYDTSCAEGI
jgi:hypothetical protein